MNASQADHRAEIAVIGAGIGGLAAAVRLAAAGADVMLLDRHDWPGGKMRAVSSPAGPVDAGPTVLTMRPVFEALFDAAGERLDDHVTLIPQPILARHWWRGGPQLDLHSDSAQSAEAIGDAFGASAAREFLAFDTLMGAALDAFEAPMMRAARPDALAAAYRSLTRPGIWPLIAPGRTLEGLLRARFTEPRLRQLFGRYATYVGGIPSRTPAVLGLIWRAEAAGVWAVKGGMSSLAQALAALFVQLGGRLCLGTPVARFEVSGDTLSGLILADGRRIACRQAVFNGDPEALRAGLLGAGAQRAVGRAATTPRALSARVWTFAAKVSGLPLLHHNLLLADDARDEFVPLARNQAPVMPTIYICAQDRAAPAEAAGMERFQFILNAPACSPDSHADPHAEAATCLTPTFDRLSRFGLTFTPIPTAANLTTPAEFASLFPGSQGSLYGRSPHGTLAPFLRPTARTRITGLYLAGGGAHPGAGVPMAALSGMHAAAAALSDRTSVSTLRQTATPGGILTRSATTAPARFR
ncbi:1-hydroxycarotenoid 3,4-desaturase CrtD [Pararhodobacter sp. SW119]|uniref:1-hydroxycarotenoid 3,4-desaturase CrtD n=1 Tax=Pararhodobacter sp. SW119 TaxID=2780075 RepID=UPI001ADF68DD|nr:1-hydroxycarotenoid 3,4-desaturase CrtD [Pararhodobacter sp. SW119]